MFGEATAKTPTALVDEWAQGKEGLPMVSPKIDGDGEEPRFSGKYKYGRGKNPTRNKNKIVIIIISRKYSKNSDSK